MESLIDDFYYLDAFKDICEPLNVAFKVLTLDSPADIRLYNLIEPPKQSGLVNDSSKNLEMNESMIRTILSRRIDFSKEAVSKVKIFAN